MQQKEEQDLPLPQQRREKQLQLPPQLDGLLVLVFQVFQLDSLQWRCYLLCYLGY
jgi:hypothetical protein